MALARAKNSVQFQTYGSVAPIRRAIYRRVRVCLLVSKGCVRYGQFVAPHNFRLITGVLLNQQGTAVDKSLAMRLTEDLAEELTETRSKSCPLLKCRQSSGAHWGLLPLAR